MGRGSGPRMMTVMSDEDDGGERSYSFDTLLTMIWINHIIL